MSNTSTFQCSQCGEMHAGMPDLAFASPLQYFEMPEAERAQRCLLTSDTCIIDGQDRFIRGCLEIPILASDDLFMWGVWVSLSERSFNRYQELYESEERDLEGPYFGWLSNRLPGYPDTLNLKTNVHLRPYPTRPRIELEPTDHSLAVDQRVGIDHFRVKELVELGIHEAFKRHSS